MKVMVILCCILWFCTSCTFDFDEPGVCPYNVRLNYRYAGRPDAGQLSMYVDNIHQFLFDADGVLKDIRLLKGDSLEYWQGELTPGRYTLVAWGNWGYESDVVPAPQPGVTQIRELAMTSATGTATGTSTSEYRPNTERLYYGYSTFEIPATGNSVNRTVYLTLRTPEEMYDAIKLLQVRGARTLGRRILSGGRNRRLYIPPARRALRIRLSGRLRHTVGQW